MKYLLNKNTILFNDTYLENTNNLIPLNIRIKITDKKNKYYNSIGEISGYNKNKYLVKLANNYIGWNDNEIYKNIELEEQEFEPLDKGINSPWFVKIEKLLSIL